jgi:uncharacterized protein (DUF2141 family)
VRRPIRSAGHRYVISVCTRRDRAAEGKAMRALLALGTVLAVVFFGHGAEASDLRVSIQGVASSEGSLMIGLYDTPEHFRSAIATAAQAGLLNDRSRLVGIAMRAIAGTQSVVFTNLKPGAYAIIVFHDANDNGKLDENPWGAPSEGYGFSNDAEGFLAAPPFDQAAVKLGTSDKAIKITLRYPPPHPAGETPDFDAKQ